MHNVASAPAVPTESLQQSDNNDYGGLNDAELVEFMGGGDQEACAMLFQRHSREMAAWLEHKVKNLLNQPAEHFVNETFIRAFGSASTFHIPKSTPPEKVTPVVKRWLYNILRNVWTDSFRSNHDHKGKVDATGEPVFVLCDPASDQAPPSRRLSLVESFLANLEENERVLLTMTGSFYDLESKRVRIPDEIVEPLCKAMGLTRTSLRVRRLRLLEDLKAHLVANE